MQVGIYADGRALNFDEAEQAFDVAGTPVTFADVVGYDKAAQVDWLSDELREWAQGIAADLSARAQSVPADSGPQVAEVKPGRLFGFRSKRIWKMAIASLYYAACALVALGVFASVKPYATNPRDIVLSVLSYLLVVLALVSPAVLLSDFGYRQKLPLFKRRKLFWSVVGLVVVFLLLSVTAALADSLHTQPYKVAAEQERVALKQKQDAEAEAKAAEKKTAEAQTAAEAKRLAEAKKSAEASKAAEAQALGEAKRSADASRAAEAKALADAAALQKAAADAAAKAQADADAKAAAAAAAKDKARAEAEAKAAAKAQTLAIGQQQAVLKAQSYLSYTAFSRKGLIEQLVFEGFSKADATFAVGEIAPDWNEQAAKKAKSYLDYTSFSRKGLIDQLVFEGFTQAQAKYGANAVGY
jgi:cytoskeletal protein RodZ